MDSLYERGILESVMTLVCYFDFMASIQFWVKGMLDIIMMEKAPWTTDAVSAKFPTYFSRRVGQISPRYPARNFSSEDSSATSWNSGDRKNPGKGFTCWGKFRIDRSGSTKYIMYVEVVPLDRGTLYFLPRRTGGSPSNLAPLHDNSVLFHISPATYIVYIKFCRISIPPPVKQYYTRDSQSLCHYITVSCV